MAKAKYLEVASELKKRIENGVKNILTNFFNDKAFDEKDVIVSGGDIKNSSYKSK